MRTEASMAMAKENGAEGPKKPNPIDVHVGSRVRLQRMLLGMSQEKLGEKMNLTFQQIQKYEKGTNRIGASRLFQLSNILDVPVNFFFNDMNYGQPNSVSHQPGFGEPASEGFIMDFLNTREGLELNRAFVRIRSQKARRSIIELVRSLADEDDDGDGQSRLT